MAPDDVSAGRTFPCTSVALHPAASRRDNEYLSEPLIRLANCVVPQARRELINQIKALRESGTLNCSTAFLAFLWVFVPPSTEVWSAT